MPADDDLRARLVQVGRELIRTDGLQALTLREIARRSGVSHGAPRRYFPTHLELLSAIARTGFLDLGEQLAAAVAGAGTPRDRVERLAHRYVGFASEQGGMFELMFRHDLLQSGGRLGLRDTSLPLFQLLTRLVAAAGPRPPEPAQVVAAALWANLHGIALLSAWGSLELATGSDRPDDLVRVAVAAHLT